MNSNVGGSLLTAIGLPELITETEEAYESLIYELATEPQRLARIKRKLADNRLSKPLFNSALFAEHLEEGFERAYQLYFGKKRPKNINIFEL